MCFLLRGSSDSEWTHRGIRRVDGRGEILGSRHLGLCRLQEVDVVVTANVGGEHAHSCCRGSRSQVRIYLSRSLEPLSVPPAQLPPASLCKLQLLLPRCGCAASHQIAPASALPLAFRSRVACAGPRVLWLSAPSLRLSPHRQSRAPAAGPAREGAQSVAHLHGGGFPAALAASQVI